MALKKKLKTRLDLIQEAKDNAVYVVEDEKGNKVSNTSKSSSGRNIYTKGTQSTFKDIAPIRTTTKSNKSSNIVEIPLAKPSDGNDIINMPLAKPGAENNIVTLDKYNPLSVTDRILGVNTTPLPTTTDTRDLNSLSKKELLEKKKELLEQISNYDREEKRKWWDKDDNILENVGNVLYKAFLEDQDTMYVEDKTYDSLVKQLDDIEDLIEDKTLEETEYSDGVVGFIEKSGDTMVGNLYTGTKGIATTASKLLGKEIQEEDYELHYLEKSAQKAREEASNGVEKTILDVEGGVARMLPQMAVGNPTGATIVGFANYGGGAYNEARQEGYTDEQATKYGVAVGAMEMALTHALGSFGKVYGNTKLGSMSQSVIDKLIPKIIANKNVRHILAQAGSEGIEEFIQEYTGEILKDTLLDEEGLLDSAWANITDPDLFADALYSGFVGAITGATLDIPSEISISNYEKTTGRDAETGYTQNEQKIIDSLVEEQSNSIAQQKAIEKTINEAITVRETEQGGTLSAKQKTALTESIKAKIESGEIEVSNGKLTNREISKIRQEVEKNLLEGKYELSKLEDMLTPTQTEQIKELEERYKNSKDEAEKAEIQDSINNLRASKLNNLKSMVGDNKFLNKAVYEVEMSTQKYSYDESKVTDEYEKGTRESAKLFVNNTTETRKFVDVAAKLAKDRQKNYKFTNNQQLLEQGDLVENPNLTQEQKNLIKQLEKQLESATTEQQKKKIQNQIIELKYLDVGGFVRKTVDGKETVLLNVDSKQSLSAVLGHETKHLLEKNSLNESYNKMLFDYAKAKGDYDTYRKRVERLYEGIDNVDINSELSAALTGDYLFTDSKFIETLMNDTNTNTPKIIQKIKELIDDLVIRFKGTEQEKQLREVQKKFKELYKENAATENVTSKETKYNQEVYDKLKNEKQIVHVGNVLEILKSGQFSGSVATQNIGTRPSAYKGRSEGIVFKPSAIDYLNESKLYKGDGGNALLNDGTRTKENPNKYSTIEDYISEDTSKRQISKYNEGIIEKDNPIPINTDTVDYILVSKNTSQEFINEVKAMGFEVRYSTKPKSDTTYSLSEDTNLKQQQLDIVLKTNPMFDDYHTGIRTVEDILTFEEAYNNGKNDALDGGWSEYASYPDITNELIETAFETGKIKIYSSYPIQNGVFVTPSLMQATDYAGGDSTKVHSKVVSLNDVAWINLDEGQYAKVDNTNPTSDADIRYSLSEDTQGRKLSDNQKEYFKDVSPELKDENGNIKVLYHGSNSEFTIFDPNKGGASNSKAGVGFWFTESGTGAKNFAESVWYGDRTPTTYEVYLNLKNPKVYEPIDTKAQKQELNKQLKEIHKEKNLLADEYAWETPGITQMAFYLEHYSENDVINSLTKKYGYKEEKAKNYVEETKKYKQLNEEYKRIEKEHDNLGYDDSYEQFRTDIYKVAGMSANDANIGGIGMAITNNDEVVKQYRDNLIKEGYDGIVIKNTSFDTDTLGAGNNQYVAFYPNQIKNVTNENPTDNPDINLSLSQQNEDIAPTGDYNVYGEDVKLAIAPLQEEIKELTETVQELKEQIAPVQSEQLDTGVNTKIAEIEYTQPSKAELDNIMALEKTGGTEYANAFFELRDKYGQPKLYKAIREYKKAPDTYEAPIKGDEYTPVENVENSVENVSNSEIIAPIKAQNIQKKDYLPEFVDALVEREAIKEKQRELRAEERKAVAEEKAKAKELSTYENGTKRNQTKKKTLKERFVSGWDTLQSHFVNRNRQIDKLAKATGNNEIKFKGDRVNNIMSEVGGDIFTNQTDNYGNVIGKSLEAPFEEARKLGIDEHLDNYLKHQSNIERHKQGKGSKNVSLETSMEYVEAYETKYPKLKELAQDVYTYNQNLLNNALENGLIDENFKNLLTSMYSHYVPFYEINKDSIPRVDMTPDEIMGSKPIKRAEGGSSENLLSVERAMIKQTYAYKNAIAKNDLYKEIGSTINEKVELGADVRTTPLELDDALYSDESGKYLTYYDGGERTSVKIGEELYTELSRELEAQIKEIEEKYSLITKPLQEISKLRGKILTTYSTSFLVSNPLKDIQDAFFNTKYLGKYTKNVLTATTIRDSIKGKNANKYATEFKELTGMDITSVTNTEGLTREAKTLYKNYQDGAMWNRFITSYGSNATNLEYGDVDIDVKAKDKGFLNRLANANNYIEVMFRYPEFKATLQKGKSFTEALYNAREVTTNFGRGGTIAKAINRNGATFHNTSIQGIDKFIRNFSGENGARGFVNAVSKSILLGITPALLNHLLFGDDDEYEELPDYIKDNYYLFKTDEGKFIRIPKGRMISVLGSAARRTLELASGEEDAFEGYLKNASSQIGSTNPLKENIFSPIIQAYGSENGEAWYGGDLVPTRLQDKPAEEQYDESTDEFSKWLGGILHTSPYKINYLIDQYSGGVGDIVLPMITPEASSGAEGAELLYAPVADKFVVNSTDDNKYPGELFDLSDSLTKKSNSEKATNEDLLKNKYVNSVISEMNELYKKKREIQNSNLSKSEKYEQVLEVQDEINKLSKNALSEYENVSEYSNYATVGDREFYKKINSEGEVEWTKVNGDEADDLNSLGMTNEEKNTYFVTKSEIGAIISDYNGDKTNLDDLDEESDEYKEAIGELSDDKKTNIIDMVMYSGLNDEQKAYLYGKYYSSDKTLNKITDSGISFDDFLTYQKDSLSLEDTVEKTEYLYNTDWTDEAKTVIYETSVLSGYDNEDKYKGYKAAKLAGIDINSWLSCKKQEFKADKDRNGNSISGSKKKKVISYINELDLSVPEKAILIKTVDSSFKFEDYNNQIVQYVVGLDLTYEEKVSILEELDMQVDDEGYVHW